METGIDKGGLVPLITSASVAKCRSSIVECLLTNHICYTKQLTLRQKFSVSSFHITHDSTSSVSHVPGLVNVESEREDASEVETEEDWYSNTHDVQPAASKVSKAMNDEVCVLRTFITSL